MNVAHVIPQSSFEKVHKINQLIYEIIRTNNITNEVILLIFFFEFPKNYLSLTRRVKCSLLFEQALELFEQIDLHLVIIVRLVD